MFAIEAWIEFMFAIDTMVGIDELVRLVMLGIDESPAREDIGWFIVAAVDAECTAAIWGTWVACVLVWFNSGEFRVLLSLSWFEADICLVILVPSLEPKPHPPPPPPPPPTLGGGGGGLFGSTRTPFVSALLEDDACWEDGIDIEFCELAID